MIPSILSAQTPTHIDPGNSRGGEETIYLWENPIYLIPIIVIIALLILFVWIRKKK